MIKDLLHQSLESIDPQSTVFSVMTNELRTAKESKLEESKLNLNLAKIAKTYFNLNITFYDDGTYYSKPPTFQNMHTLSQSYGCGGGHFIVKMMKERELKQLELNTSGKLILPGSVDRVNAKVSGIFADYTSYIAYSYKHLMSGFLTPEEIAGIILHEVGHIFTYYEYIQNETTANQVMATAVRALLETDDVTERKTILVNVKHHQSLDIESVEELARMSNEAAVSVIYLKQKEARKRAQRRSTVAYDVTAYESLADQFATRCGAGTHVASALRKLGVSDRSNASKTTYVLLNLFTIGTFLFFFMPMASLTFTTIAKMVFTNKWLISGASTLMNFIALPYIGQQIDPFNYGDAKDYDNLAIRFKRIREDLVAQLKKGMKDKEQRESLLLQIELMDNMLKDYNEHKPMFRFLWDVLGGGKNTNARLLGEKIDRQLESMTHNDLFVQAAQLKSL